MATGGKEHQRDQEPRRCPDRGSDDQVDESHGDAHDNHGTNNLANGICIG